MTTTALTTGTFIEDTRRWLEDAERALAAFRALPPEATAAEVVAAYDAIGVGLDRAAHGASLFFQVHPDPQVREHAARVEQDASRFATALSLDRDVYERLSAIDPAELDDPVARRLVDKTLRDLRRAGVDRDEATRARVSALREELVETGQAFLRNIAADVRELRLPPSRLDGLPADWLAAHPPDAEGLVTVTTNPPDYLPFMQYCRDAGAREELYGLYMRRAAPDNLGVLARLLERRAELVALLGYGSWAEYVTEDKMIGSAEAADAFIRRVSELAGGRYARDLEELRARAAADGTPLRDCDRVFVAEAVRREAYAFDTTRARPYFPFASVLRGVLETSERLYGISFVRVDPPAWHPSVSAFDLVEDGEPRARVWLDMHPREDKYQHAAMFTIASGVEGGALPEACLVCNFPEPTADDPALLEPRQVRTLFHEFGHLLHHLFAGRQRYLDVSGIATEWDFVEVPSQLYEEWARDLPTLRRFARHHATGEPLPAELFERMRRAEAFGKGLDARVQMFYAALSLELHRVDPAALDLDATVARLRAELVPDFPLGEGAAFPAAFGHLEGYSALYYTYMWSLVLAKDLRSRFGDDLMDRGVADAYRRAVLEPGGSKDAAELVEDFLGRPFSFDAFEAWMAA